MTATKMLNPLLFCGVDDADVGDNFFDDPFVLAAPSFFGGMLDVSCRDETIAGLGLPGWLRSRLVCGCFELYMLLVQRYFFPI